MRKTKPCGTLAAKILKSDFWKKTRKKSPKVRRKACGTLLGQRKDEICDIVNIVVNSPNR